MAGSSQGYNREITLADAEEMLGHIDSDSLDYESWAKLGRSLASEFGDSARDAFITWNSPAGEKEKTRLLEQWKEFLKSHSYSIGTLIMEAKSRGWSSKDSRELSAEERTEIKKQAEQRRKDAAQRAQAAEKEAAHELKRVELRFRNLPLYTGTESLYLQRKGIANAHQFTELRVGKDSHNNETWVAWPLLNESGEFKGY
ncbi:PriCT-2 domain-containing protein, partial [Marinobacterium jannaschii]|uniref:PriCT-2 domain-containing protein n=1 Tax=Marinobacterium jannaschii TaxID=64970 RepID=UPI0004838FD3